MPLPIAPAPSTPILASLPSAVTSGAGKGGLALFEEGSHAFGVIGAPPRRGLRLRFQLQLLLQGVLAGAVEQLLDEGECLGGLGGELAGHLVAAFFQRAGRHHLIDETHRRCIGGGERLTQHHERGRPRGAHQPGEKSAAAGIGHQPDIDEGLDELGVRGGNDQVAGQRDVGSRPRGGAVYPTDHRLRQGPDGPHDRIVGAAQVLGEVHHAAAFAGHRFGQILAGTEGPARAGQVDAPERTIIGHPGQHLDEPGRHRLVETVEHIGTVERDASHAVARLDQDAVRAHWVPIRRKRTKLAPHRELGKTGKTGGAGNTVSDAFLVDGVRTPIGSLGGSLASVRADDLAAHVISALLARHPGLDPSAISDVVMGCANQAGEDNRNVARMALLLAGLPASVPGETVNRLCASGMSAVGHAARAARLGDGDLYIAGGVEHMTRAPYVLSKAAQPFARSQELFDTSLGWRFVNPKMKEKYGVDAMGQTAENVAEQYGITREDQDRFALWSQQKAAAAGARLAVEIVPVTLSGAKGSVSVFNEDEFIRPATTLEVLAKLRPAFRTDGKGSVTAGNSSGLNDGAAALLVASEAGVKRHGLTPVARVVSTAVSGVEPRVMGIGPVPASREALAKAGLAIAQMDVIELNEAFAAQSLAVTRDLGLADDDPRVNPNGGAIALGHPLGMSGARLLLTAMRELEQRGGRYALCTMCIGVGQGMATILERS